jgi:Na+-driven multidrug efflux pump
LETDRFPIPGGIMDAAQQSTPAIDQRTRVLLEAPVLPTLLKLAAPNMLVMLAQMLIGLVEVYFLARLGVDALAGASLVFPVLSLITALSQGSVGGGVVTAIARSLGRGQRAQANQLVWYAVAIAAFFGLLTSAVILSAGQSFYRAMGAEGASLAVANTYSSMVFGGAILIWVFNLLLAAVRGTGNLLLPVAIVCGGALILLPLSPMLIFGLGPLPAFGIAGAATAILLYYGGGSLCFALYLWGGSGILRPSTKPPRLSWAPFREILRVGGMSALVSSTTNLTIAIITAYVGTAGVAALAGYGAGARLEFILVPFTYGIGGPAGILIGTNIGAGQGGRALQTAWITLLLSALATEAIVLRIFRDRLRALLRRARDGAHGMAGCRRCHPRGDRSRRWRCRDQARSKPQSHLYGGEPWHDELRLVQPTWSLPRLRLWHRTEEFCCPPSKLRSADGKSLLEMILSR